MDWTSYINSFEKITIDDIAGIINEGLNNEENTYYRFKKQKGVVLFGELSGGSIIKPYLVSQNNMDNLCEELYTLLVNNFPLVFHYSYEHYFSGEYEYYGYTDDEKLMIRFPNVSPKNQEWIFNQVHNDNQRTL